VHHRLAGDLADIAAFGAELFVEEGFRLPDEGEEGDLLFLRCVEEAGDVAVGDEEEVAGAIWSKPNSEHLVESSEHLVTSSEHLPRNSEHLDTLHEIAEPVRSLQKAPRGLVGVTILCLCEAGF
jgi:hypothetical protein